MNTLKTTFLMALLTILLTLIGGAIGGKGGMTMAFLLAGGMNSFSYWFSDKIVLSMYGAQQIEEHDNPLTGGGMMSLFSTHPPIPERVHRLEEISRAHAY